MTQRSPEISFSETVGVIETELSELWRPVRGEPPKVRASTMNLVVLAGEEPTEELLALIDALGATHPARSLILGASKRLEACSIDSDVRAICRDDPGGEVICSERVVLTLGEDAASRATSIVAALSMADLPTVVLVTEDSGLLPVEAFLEKADRLIVDSRHIALDRIDTWFTKAAGVTTDLGFIEMFPWRDLVARAFDSPSRLPMLRGLERVEIRHAAREDGRVPADVRLFIGWLTSRLSGSILGRDSARLADRDVHLEVRGEAASPRGVGSILGITLRGQVGGSPCRVTVERLPEDSGFVTTTEGCGEPSEHRFRLIARDERWLLTRALDATEPDRVLRESVPMAARWSP